MVRIPFRYKTADILLRLLSPRPRPSPLSFRFFTSSIRVPMSSVMSLPECWGHRGASATFPENTLASFEAAIREGADGIESDVHVSADDVVVMFHDPALNRTTNGAGLIRELKWHGENGMEHLRTVKQPAQAIPTFLETVSMLMKPENRHVKFNVDVKAQNDPARLFKLMHNIISSYDNWETELAPRIVLGLWHPTFIPHAQAVLPYLRRSYIGDDLAIARKYFWSNVDVFSMRFAVLATASGEKFRKDCQSTGKKLMVWTVNEPDHMIEAARWSVDVIITDVPKKWLDLRSAMQTDYKKVTARSSRLFLWTDWQFYSPFQIFERQATHRDLEIAAGPFSAVDMSVSAPLVGATEA